MLHCSWRVLWPAVRCCLITYVTACCYSVPADTDVPGEGWRVTDTMRYMAFTVPAIQHPSSRPICAVIWSEVGVA